jgi:serine/threonine protein kinase
MLDVSTAVSLLMPGALQLRDKHQQGEVYLKISPDNLLVTPKGCIISPKASGAGFLNERFAAPEQLEGRYTGIKSDIYSFMAVLSYAISDEALAAAPNLALIIAKGMSTDPEQRYASMQDVIFTLSPFNTGEVNLAREHSDRQMARTEKPVKPKLKIKYGLLIPACVLVLLGAFAGYVLINHNNAVMAMGELDFATAGASFDNTLLGGQLWPKEQAYINAGLLMESGDFDGAVTAFEALGDYSDAPTMILEAQYRKATTLMNGGDFDNAKILYESLGEYKDSKAQVLEVQYRQAAFLTADNQFNEAKAIYDSLGDYKDSKGLAISALINKLQYEIEKEDYVNALATIRTLDDSMYEDIDELIKPLLPKLYEIGIDLYNNDNYHIAYKYFDFLNGKNYEKSDTYMVLATLHLLNGGFVSVPDSTLNQYYNNLLSYLGFEDVNAVIISNRKMALNFLNGSWRNGSYYFSCISDKFQVRYNLPEIHGRYYELINGIFYTNNYRIWEGGLSPYTGVKRMSQSFDPRL